MTNLSKEEMLAANVVIMNLTPNDQYNFGGVFMEWLRKYDADNNTQHFQKIILENKSTTYDNVHGYLLRNEFICRYKPLREEKYLTPKGILTQKKGSIENYLKFERCERNKQFLKDFIIYIFVPVITFLTLMFMLFNTHLSCNTNTANNKNATSQIDTAGKNNHP